MRILLAFVFGFFFTEAVGYLIHRLLHSRWSGALHRSHMNHHLTQYPPDDYLSETYRQAGTDNTAYRFVVAGVILAGLALWLTPLWLALPIMINMAAIGFVNSYVHDATHISNHWLESFPHFWYLRELHRVHHIEMGKNFGIVTFFTDRIARTFRP